MDHLSGYRVELPLVTHRRLLYPFTVLPNRSMPRCGRPRSASQTQ
ncbi:hypothetical protein OEM_27460 [Mycobacterium intracellulare subsp. yongonense 05-1390]|nr:hypothetical protein OEM_27460 [Mycobacterium intracellulare subsp. yongonense 05-1390]ARR78411.1 hypothetical protein MOTT12_02747 [Mycobacterium intracellulare subsp. yongonense]ARR83498.1 hypothetical protein MOTT27_02677 [Mycobacterium intracellulare subsp. yongonense]